MLNVWQNRYHHNLSQLPYEIDSGQEANRMIIAEEHINDLTFADVLAVLTLCAMEMEQRPMCDKR